MRRALRILAYGTGGIVLALSFLTVLVMSPATSPQTVAAIDRIFFPDPNQELRDGGQAAKLGDFGLAAEHYRKGANKGNARAQLYLALLYSKGQGVPKDEATYALWLRRAANQGLADARVLLAYAYRLGHGVPMDTVLAYMWVNLAATSTRPEDAEGVKNAIEYRDYLTPRMTRDQLQEAQRLTREWRKPA